MSDNHYKCALRFSRNFNQINGFFDGLVALRLSCVTVYIILCGLSNTKGKIEKKKEET